MTDDARPLVELARLRQMRSELDRTERRLMETARAQGISWAQIASSLGLASRQAAEQRWLRLCATEARDPAVARDARRRQQSADMQYGPQIADLRAATIEAYQNIEDDRGWGQRHPHAALVRETLAAAVSAPPGALFALAAQAVHDLTATPWPSLPTGLASHLHRLQGVVTAAYVLSRPTV